MRQIALRSLSRAEQRAIDNEMARRKALENIGPTPETVAKLRPNNVETLRANDIIDDAQTADIHRIGRAVELIAAPVRLKTAGVMFVDHGKSDGPLSDYDHQALVWYQAWWDWLMERNRRNAWVICYDVAVDGLSLREIEAARRMGRRTVRGLLLYGLEAYAGVKRR